MLLKLELLEEKFMNMKRNKFNNSSIFQWISWFLLVVIWNYGFPEALPFYDVLVAFLLSLLFVGIKNIYD